MEWMLYLSCLRAASFSRDHGVIECLRMIERLPYMQQNTTAPAVRRYVHSGGGFCYSLMRFFDRGGDLEPEQFADLLVFCDGSTVHGFIGQGTVLPRGILDPPAGDVQT